MSSWNVRLWREPDLWGEFTVQEDGTVVFPKVGPLIVARVSIDSLTRQLTAHYSASLRNPAVESFDRTNRPHGAAGRAKPHGAVFSRPEGQ